MKNKVCYIFPYYGKFPNYFDLWLESVRHNAHIADFYIITDSDFPFSTIPSNVFLVNISLNEIKERLDKVTGVNCCLKSPYKLCDYRPAYGAVFNDIVRGYDFWGWCDPDIIWGDLSLFINDDTMSKFDVIGGRGPCTLQRNTPYFVNLFKKKNRTINAFTFDEARSTNLNLIYDEWGYARLRKEEGVKETDMYNWFLKRALDILPPKGFGPHRVMKIRFSEGLHFVEYSDGKIFDVEILRDDIVNKKEYAYVHLQKRMMDRLCRDKKHFLIYNETFLPHFMYEEVICNIQQHFDCFNEGSSVRASGWGKMWQLLQHGKKTIFKRLLRKIGL